MTMVTTRNILLLLVAGSSALVTAQTEVVEVEVNDGLEEEVSSLRPQRRELYSFGSFSFSSLLCKLVHHQLFISFEP